MDCSLPGSSVHGIFQARGLEWVASAFSDHSPYPSVNPSSLSAPWLSSPSPAEVPGVFSAWLCEDEEDRFLSRSVVLK